ncbi:MAG: hypothetical protein Q8O13_08725 [Candidatus Omnitrophota bacterium]|nr:hypothetical protein [Candidatus Omnitrophota bacterium]
MKDRGFEEIKTKNGKFKMPKWMDCAWKRVSCEKDSCPICGRIKKDHQKHIERGEDADSIESAFEDIAGNFKETLELIKKDCETKGIELTNVDNIKEPPEPEKFPLYNRVNKWRNLVLNLEESLEDDIYYHTEAAADLFWYVNILASKIYRQLTNKWEIKHGDKYGDVDYKYTGCVIKECLKILKKSLRDLSLFNLEQKVGLMLIHDKLLNLEKEIFKNLTL